MNQDYQTPLLLELDSIPEGILCESGFDLTIDNLEREDFVW